MTAATTTTAASSSGVTNDEVAKAVPSKRKRTPLLIGAMVFAASTVAGGWYLLNLGRESTDDAQVEGRVMNVSARVSGQVLRVHVTDNQIVNAGDILVELDPADYAARLEVAKADLAAARASVQGAQAALDLTEKTAPANVVQAQGGMTAAASSVISARASIAQARADLAAAESRKALVVLNLGRSKTLLAQNAIAIAEVDGRQTELDGASADVEQAQARLAGAEAALAGSSGGVVLAKGRLHASDTANEQVASARAALALADARVKQMESGLTLAELNLSYATVKATRRGVVSRRTVEEGQMVSPDRPLFAIVPLDDVWIVANFKEDQLSEMSPGQAATVHLDTYAKRELHGHVESIAGGTGARFALLPPDNATGNFVKVVQRVPVVIRVDGAEGLSMRPGMSADVTVRTSVSK